MANPLFSALGGANNQMTQIANEVNRLKSTFTGDPRAEVQKLLNSGQMSQAQFNQFAQFANQIISSGLVK